jgi:AraC-like DNA-binding protein/TolB-like protein
MPGSVRRALDAMQGNPSSGWSVSELAAVAGVSGRTLQRLFQSFLGKTPQAVLRDIRFDGARRALLQGVPDMGVADVALRCGFPHFGRFSIEYRRRYGEMPSQTLKRQAVLVGVLASMPAVFSPRVDRPTLVMMPIEADAENDEAARGIADDLATALTRAGVAVASQHRSARYRLTGVIRGQGKQARLTFRLLDAETGRQLWAQRSDGALGDFALDEQLATRMTAALQPALRLAEIDRARAKPEADLNANDLALLAMPHVLSLDAAGNARSIELLERAMELDPDHALATALAAWAHAQGVVYHFAETPLTERTRSADLAMRALVLGGDSAARAILGSALTSIRELDTADLVIRKALSVDGSSAWVWGRSGWVDLFKGDTDSAIERFKIALELAPHDTLAFNNFVGIGCAHFHAGRYLESARWQERALLEHPSSVWVHRTLSPAYVLGGAMTEARRSLAVLREEFPGLTIASVSQCMPPLPSSYRDRLIDALQTVGLPR